jgi:hypothetical protein
VVSDTSLAESAQQQDEERDPIARENSKVEAQLGMAMPNQMLMDTNGGERQEQVNLERQEDQS